MNGVFSKMKNILLFDNHSENNGRVIIFGTKNNLKLTCANTWYADINFGLVPKYFSQLFITRIENYNELLTVLICIYLKKIRVFMK